jgi:ATP-dependent Zn protease
MNAVWRTGKEETMVEDQERRTAYHEAAHTALAVLYGAEVGEVTIVPNEEAHGHLKGRYLTKESVEYGDSMEDRDRVEKDAMIALAGELAERRVATHVDPSGAAHDYANVHELLSYMTRHEEEIQAYVAWLIVRTKNQLDRYWPEVDALATALLERRTLTGPEIVTIVRGVAASRTQANEKCDARGRVHPAAAQEAVPMAKTFTLTLTVKCEDGEEEDFACRLAQHIRLVFDDDGSILNIEGAWRK